MAPTSSCYNDSQGIWLVRTWSLTSGGRRNSEAGFLSGQIYEVSSVCQTNCGFEVDQFKFHKQLGNRVPTIFISTTDYLLWALKTGINRPLDGEQGAKLSFIYLPNSHRHLIKNAECLAVDAGLTDPHKYYREYVFRNEIEGRFVVFTISMDCLIQQRKLLEKIPLLSPNSWPDVEEVHSESSKRLPPTWKIQKAFSSRLWSTYLKRKQYFDCGMHLANLASLFGHDAPQAYISFEM